MRAVRTLLTGFLLVVAALLSFGALRHRALDAGIIHGDIGLPVPHVDLRLSAHTLAGCWALVLKALTVVGILGIRSSKGRDPRAWVALALGLVLDLLFQTYGYDTWIARAQAAVPPVALAMAVWIFEMPHAALEARPVQASGPPAPARLHRWLDSWKLPADDPPPPVVARAGRSSAAPVRARATTGLSDTQQATVRASWQAGERSVRAMAREVGRDTGAGRQQVARVVEELQAASRN